MFSLRFLHNVMYCHSSFIKNQQLTTTHFAPVLLHKFISSSASCTTLVFFCIIMETVLPDRRNQNTKPHYRRTLYVNESVSDLEHGWPISRDADVIWKEPGRARRGSGVRWEKTVLIKGRCIMISVTVTHTHR